MKRVCSQLHKGSPRDGQSDKANDGLEGGIARPGWWVDKSRQRW